MGNTSKPLQLQELPLVGLGKILKREKAPQLQASLKMLCLLPPIFHCVLCHREALMPPLPVSINGLQTKLVPANGLHR